MHRETSGRAPLDIRFVFPDEYIAISEWKTYHSEGPRRVLCQRLQSYTPRINAPRKPGDRV